MSSKSSPVNQLHLQGGTRMQYRLVNNNNRLIFLNRSSLFNQLLTNRHNQNDNFCLYLHRFCLQTRLDGYNYCIRHILYDKNAPFRQCTFIYANTGKRCPNAARRLDRRDAIYCPWHIKKKNLDLRKKESQSDPLKNTYDNASTHENLKRKFDQLEHYCPSNEHDHKRKNVDWDLPDDKCITASKSLREKINDSINNQSLSLNEDDITSLTLSDVLNLDFDSDNESAESYMDDPLRHAGVYTAEEIAHILRDKILRLQTLYINLLNYYRHILKNKMRDYYLNLKNEKSNSLDPNVAQVNCDPLKEQLDCRFLKAMHKYNNVSGSERVIKNASSDIRRSFIDEKEPACNYSTCIYVKDLGPCNDRCIPLSNYCKAHILFDCNQILYRPCAGGSPACLSPVISYVHKNNCIKHTQFKFENSDIDNIMKSPTKIKSNDSNNSLAELVNEPELFQSMEDEIALEIDHEPGNLFIDSLDNFDIDNTDMLT